MRFYAATGIVGGVVVAVGASPARTRPGAAWLAILISAMLGADLPTPGFAIDPRDAKAFDWGMVAFCAPVFGIPVGLYGHDWYARWRSLDERRANDDGTHRRATHPAD